MERWNAFQTLITEITRDMVSLPWREVDAGINVMLARIGAFVGAHRAYIFQCRDDGMMDNTHEWCAEGIAPQIENLRNQPMDLFPWWMERLRNGETIHVPRVADLPPEASAERHILHMQDIVSVIVVPLVRGSVTTGFMGFDSVNEERVWPQFVALVLRVVADILAAVLERRQSDEALHKHHARMEQTIADRTHLAMAEAARAKQSAEELARTVEMLKRTNLTLVETQEKLQASEESSRLLVANSTLAMAVHEMVFDADGQPADYIFLSANAAFERDTGLSRADIVGHRITEVLPGIRETGFIELYGDVVATGKPVVTEQYSEPLQRHYSINAYPLGGTRFATCFQDITKRKHMEQALEEGHKRLETILNAFPDLVFIMDREGVIKDYHSSTPTLLYVPPETFIGHRLDTSLPGDVATALNRCIGRAFTSGEHQSHTYSLEGQDGIAHYEARLCRMDAQRIIGIVRNVTARARAVADLEASEERYRYASMASRDTIWEYDCVSNVKTCSELGNATYGWAADAAHPRSAEWWMERVHPEDRARVESLLADSLVSSECNHLQAEYRFRKANGEYAYVDDRCYILRDKDGAAERVIGAMQDVTKRKREEITQARLQRQLQQAQQIAQAGSWEYDNKENLLLWSGETYRIFGMQPRRFGQSYEAFLATVHPEDLPQVKEAYARSLAEPGYAYELNHRMIRRDTGEVRIVHEKCTHERDADGHVVRSYGLVQDITESVKRNTLLHQSQKLEAMGRLAAGVAHEINNPVSFLMNNFAALETDVICFRDLLTDYRALRGKAESVPGLSDDATLLAVREREANLDFIMADLDSLLSESKAGLVRIADIVTGMQKYSRDDRTDSRESFDVHDGIKTMLAVARNEYKYHCLVTTDFARDLPSIPCVAGKIGQVLLNLFMNAVQAIKEQQRKDKGHIYIRTYRDGNSVCVEVGDDGPGIAPAIRDTIFEPFATTKPTGKGTGLGLSISHDIVVSQHGGNLTVASGEGDGAVFRVCLPVNRNADTKGEGP